MRIRTIKPEFFKHDGLASLPALTRILFVGLWCIADCEGRLEDRPARIRVEVLPYDDIDVDSALTQLADGGFIVRYHADGLSLIQVTNFGKHQRITGKESEASSKFPGPNPEPCEPAQVVDSKGQQQGSTRATPEMTGNGRETETEGKGKDRAPAAPESESVPYPLFLNTPEFREVFERWMGIRRLDRKPKMGWMGLFDEQLRWLEKLGSVEAAIESVSKSIRNGYTGLHAPDARGVQRNQPAPQVRLGENLRDRKAS